MNTDLLRPVAAAMFEVPLDAEPDAVERALLERLRDWELKLPPQGVTAYRLLTSGDAPDGAAWYPLPLLAERNCLQAIGEFADQYFELPISLRRAQWDELHAIGRHFPRSRAWLEQLRRGLNVEPGACDDPAVAELAAGICALWIARPDRYAAARHALWERALADPERWQRAAQALRRQARELARLEPELVDTLRRWDKITKRAARRHSPSSIQQLKRGAQLFRYAFVVAMVLIILIILLIPFSVHSETRATRNRTPDPFSGYTKEQIENGEAGETVLRLMGYSEEKIEAIRQKYLARKAREQSAPQSPLSPHETPGDARDGQGEAAPFGAPWNFVPPGSGDQNGAAADE